MKLFDMFKRKIIFKAFIYLDEEGTPVPYGRITSSIRWLTDWRVVKGFSWKKVIANELDKLEKEYPKFVGCIYIF